jgi:hypothetical protein
MNNTVIFTINGTGTFEFRSRLSVIEEAKLEMLMDEFLDYKLDERRSRAFNFRNLAIANILAEHFGGRKKSDLNDEETKTLEELYQADDSSEVIIARKMFWELTVIEDALKLDMLKVKTPKGFDFHNIDEMTLLKIMGEYNKAIAPAEQKKN